jgi:hypothetical protein
MAARARHVVDEAEGAKALNLLFKRYPAQEGATFALPSPADVAIFRVDPVFSMYPVDFRHIPKVDIIENSGGDDPPSGERGAGASIRFFLAERDRSHWYRVDAAAVWLWQAGDLVQTTDPATYLPPFLWAFLTQSRRKRC